MTKLGAALLTELVWAILVGIILAGCYFGILVVFSAIAFILIVAIIVVGTKLLYGFFRGLS